YADSVDNTSAGGSGVIGKSTEGYAIQSSAENCIAAPPSPLSRNMNIIVQRNNGIPLSLRAGPSSDFQRVLALDAGTLGTVLEGPVCGLNTGLYAWYRIKTVKGQVGWVAEGD